jgi:DNA-binding NarL/FixJ family response regulator
MLAETKGEQPPTSIFLLAENRLLREIFSRLAAMQRGIQVVGVAAICSGVALKIVAAAPEVVLCDSLSGMLSGEDLFSYLKHHPRNIKVVMFGMDEDPENFLTAVRHGAAGYLLKDASAAEIASAIRAVAKGESICPTGLIRCLFEYIVNSGLWHPGVQVRTNLGLTRREQQLVQLVSEGLTNKEIGERLFLSEQTIKNHLRHMLRKAGATNRLEAVEHWRAQGFWT